MNYIFIIIVVSLIIFWIMNDLFNFFEFFNAGICTTSDGKFGNFYDNTCHPLSNSNAPSSDSDYNIPTITDETGSWTNTGDNTAPTAAITYNSPGPYKKVGTNSTIIITATFSEIMDFSPVPQITITFQEDNGWNAEEQSSEEFIGIPNVSAKNMTKTSATVYTYSYTIPSGNGIGKISLSTVQDLSGNLITSIPTSGATFIVANTAPTAAITYSSPGPYKKDGTNATIIITATFSKSMKDNPIPKLAITGKGIPNVGAINMTKTSATVYTYSYTIPSGNGTGTISLSTGKDIEGNNLIISIPTIGATFTVDNVDTTVLLKDTTNDTCIDNIHAGSICKERHPSSNMYGLKKITPCDAKQSKFECENLWFNEKEYKNVINATSCINKSIDFDEACRIFQPIDNSLKTQGYNMNSIGSKQILYGKNGDCYDSSGNEDFNKGRALCSYDYNTNMTKLDHIQNNYDYNVFTDCKNIKSNFNQECKTLLGKTGINDKVYAYINGFDCLPGFGRAKCIDKSKPINETKNMKKFIKDANIEYLK